MKGRLWYLSRLTAILTLVAASTWILPSTAWGDPPTGGTEKEELLRSDAWRGAKKGYEVWLKLQVIYSDDEVLKLKEEMDKRTDEMTVIQLRDFLADLQLKLEILDSEAAYETRAWAAQTLRVLNESRAAELRGRLPDAATMSATELKQSLLSTQQNRASMIAQAASSERHRRSQVAAEMSRQQQADTGNRRTRGSGVGSYYPQLRSQSQTRRVRGRYSSRYPIFRYRYGWLY